VAARPKFKLPDADEDSILGRLLQHFKGATEMVEVMEALGNLQRERSVNAIDGGISDEGYRREMGQLWSRFVRRKWQKLTWILHSMDI
jgi:hypothetical protein